MDIMETKATAWEELGGQSNVSREKYQAALLELEQAQARMMPCPLDRALDLLRPNLILCSPSGMSEDDRLEWCMAALATIGDMPEDLLDEACRAGRRRCDHPAKIVPFICDDESNTVKPWLDTLKRRKEELRVRGILFANVNAPRLEKHDPQYMTAQDLAEIKAELAGALNANRK